MLRHRVLFRLLAASWPTHTSEVCTINTSGFGQAVACDDNGNVNVADLKAKAEQHSQNLSCLMITYPSTQGVFEEAIREICDTIHGHGGIAVVKDRVFAGFSDGHVVALNAATGEVAWVRSLAGDQRTFVDVDTTPILEAGVVFAASATGGLYGLDASDGTERWHDPAVKGVSQIALDGGRLYAAAAENGLYVLDLAGHVLWRQGFTGAGDPARPVIDGRYLFLSMSERGLYIIDKRDGSLLQSFNPGGGISSVPALEGGSVYLLSNGGILYAMNVGRY